ncbi:hypothetical protein BGZ58_000906 [Dissophora ornata]|nr:hypothetical protein BGZ58_000906 [Dissophora ornata]
MEIFKTTLLPMSIYGFSTTVVGILLSTTVGSIVDTTPRLPAVQSFLFTQKFTTVLGALGFWVLLTWFDPSSGSIAAPETTTTSSGGMSLYQGYSAFAFLVLASGVLKLSALGWSISIERDWIVALCQSDSDILTKINVTMKRIDLVCKLISPLVFAAMLSKFNAGYCSLAMAVWCMFSFCMELVLVRRIWYGSPVLWQPRSLRRRGREDRGKDNTKKRNVQRVLSESDPVVVGTGDEEQDLLVVDSRNQHGSRTGKGRERSRRSPFWNGVTSFWQYAHHIVFLASLSNAIIYINMMSVSGTMIGYLQWRGFTASSIALLKGICTVSELFGTILMPVMTRYLGLVRAGAWSIWLEVFTLTPVLFSIYSDRLPIQVVIFVGMALSRVGVWSFDLVITQIMQEYVGSDYDESSGSISHNNNTGVINGWHYSMMNLFELGQFILTMIWSGPQTYFIPCTLSFICVIVGAIVYSAHVVRMRGHLFHYQRIASATSSCLGVEEDRELEDEEDVLNQERIEDGQPGPSRRAGIAHRVNDDDDA